mgnify:CR=1 FL=1
MQETASLSKVVKEWQGFLFLLIHGKNLFYLHLSIKACYAPNGTFQHSIQEGNQGA